jgi:molybdenum cofactor synthesis domain-containing protein
MTESDLLNKTELKINGIVLRNANLHQIAAVVADTLEINPREVLVTDVQDEHVVIDILKRGLNTRDIVGKEDQLLRTLSKIPGVGITERGSISSRGMLSWIAADPGEGRRAVERSGQIAERIRKRLAKTALVFSTGSEVSGGKVMDTNTPTVKQRLASEGYYVKKGPTLKDDDVLIAAHLREAVDDGYGLVITTGGVGAEDKDRTIEAVLLVDPEAATPHVVKYQLGIGRHKHKNTVRIAVGRIAQALIIALPGPNEEVKAGLDALVKGLRLNLSKELLAEDIASSLRGRFNRSI